MTGLDHVRRAPGYFDSAWPAECGGSRRQKTAGSPGLDLRPGERLVSTTRDTGGWSVMFVQREPGELFLLCGAGLRDGEAPPAHRPDGDSAGWLERVDPVTLATLARSPDLPSGGWLWCGAVAVHANGDLYVVNGRYVHRLDAKCDLLASCELPSDDPHNGLAVLPDGRLLTRNLGFRPNQPAVWVVLDPERLDIVGQPLRFDERCMGRFSVDTVDGVTHVYFTTATELRRLQYADGRLTVDRDWRASYAVADGQTDAWDTTVADGSVWMMDMGRPPHWTAPGTASQRAFRVSIADPGQADVVDVIGSAGAFSPGPPLYDAVRRVLVHYDSVAGRVVAQRFHGPGELEVLWDHRLRNFVQMMCWADTGELVVEDSQTPGFDMDGPSGDLVVLDIETGDERGRAPLGMPATFGMFCCPGFDRDVYVAGIPGGVARVSVSR